MTPKIDHAKGNTAYSDKDTKKIWSPPVLATLETSETLGHPGANQGDGEAPFTALKDKISGS